MLYGVHRTYQAEETGMVSSVIIDRDGDQVMTINSSVHQTNNKLDNIQVMSVISQV